jgi:hypothetical protein
MQNEQVSISIDNRKRTLILNSLKPFFNSLCDNLYEILYELGVIYIAIVSAWLSYSSSRLFDTSKELNFIEVFFTNNEHLCSINWVIVACGWVICFKFLNLFKKQKYHKTFNENKEKIERLESGKELQAVKNKLNDLQETFDLQQKEQHTTIEKISDNLLLKIQNDILNLTGHERISLYKHIKDSKAFFIIGRYCRDPNYSEKIFRIYPDNQGIISMAMKGNGYHFHDNLPAPDQKEYKEIFKTLYNMPKITTQNLKMKSRAYFAMAIEDTTNSKRSGVLVVESIQPSGLNCNELLNELRKYNDYLALCISAMTFSNSVFLQSKGGTICKS